jgi:chromatin assembly factor 1 subunit A
LFGTYQKTSKVINARNPFRKDDEIIDYEMDSEDEMAEENGEDLENKKDEEEDDEMEEGAGA